METYPGQSVEYVVVDDTRTDTRGVRLAHEGGEYDTEFYEGLLIRAAESVLSPLSWDGRDIRKHMDRTTSVTLSSYSESATHD
jgi:DNA polymerase I